VGNAACIAVTGVVHAGLWWGNLRERGHLEDIGIDGGIILKCIFKKWVGNVVRIYLAQSKDRWRTL